MKKDRSIIFETDRLIIRLAEEDDTDLFFNLWTNSEVMKHVGFPHGLRTTRDDIRKQIQEQDDSEFDHLLVVILKGTGQSLGECFMSRPSQKGISKTDIKLLPECRGKKYGIEVKKGLISYLFSNTECTIIEADPNVNNLASIKMQEAVGGKRIGERTFEFPESMRDYTIPVHSYIYHVRRQNNPIVTL